MKKKNEASGFGRHEPPQKWKIRSKRDRGIAFLFAALLCYGFLGRFTWRINRALLYWTDPRVSDLNQPSGYGNVALTALVMGTAAGIVFLCKKRPVRRALLSFLTGGCIAAVSIGGYFFHCSLLAHVPAEEEPVSISVERGWDDRESWHYSAYNQNGAEAAGFVRLCASLEKLPKEQQKQARAFYEKNRSEGGEQEIRIRIQYPEKYLHSYALLLVMENGQIFARRDGGANLVFFSDNGLYQAAQELLSGAALD